MAAEPFERGLIIAEWERLKQALEEHCAAAARVSPAQHHFESGGNEAVVTNLRNRKRVALQFNPEVPCIDVTTARGRSVLTFRQSADGKIVQILDNGGMPRFVGDYVFFIVQSLK
jgi:hypothetical protein